MKHHESAHQQQVIEWARWASRSAKYPMLNMLHCSLNGVKLSKMQAGIAKAQGMLSGVPDLFLPVPRGKYHGLYIEMKHGSNTLTAIKRSFCRTQQMLALLSMFVIQHKKQLNALKIITKTD